MGFILERPILAVGSMEEGVGGFVVEDAALDGVEIDRAIHEGGEVGDLEEFRQGAADFEG